MQFSYDHARRVRRTCACSLGGTGPARCCFGPALPPPPTFRPCHASWVLWCAVKLGLRGWWVCCRFQVTHGGRWAVPTASAATECRRPPAGGRPGRGSAVLGIGSSHRGKPKQPHSPLLHGAGELRGCVAGHRRPAPQAANWLQLFFCFSEHLADGSRQGGLYGSASWEASAPSLAPPGPPYPSSSSR